MSEVLGGSSLDRRGGGKQRQRIEPACFLFLRLQHGENIARPAPPPPAASRQGAPPPHRKSDLRARQRFHGGKTTSPFHSRTRMETFLRRGSVSDKRCQFVIMGGEQPPALIGVVQMLHRRPGDGHAVKGRCAAPDFVKHHQRAFRRLIEDRGGLNHFNHKCRPSAREIVRRADAGKDAVSNADMRRSRGNITARLCKNRDQRILAQKRRFTRHIGTRDEPEFRRAFLRKHATIGDENLLACFSDRLFHNRMPPFLNLESKTIIDDWARIFFRMRKMCIRCCNIDRRRCISSGRNISGALADAARQLRKEFQLTGERLIAGAGYFESRSARSVVVKRTALASV